jgi:hypothetical protein
VVLEITLPALIYGTISEDERGLAVKNILSHPEHCLCSGFNYR